MYKYCGLNSRETRIYKTTHTMGTRDTADI